jgi:hypothetical protein
LPENFCTDPAENAKRTEKDCNEDYPEFLH